MQNKLKLVFLEINYRKTLQDGEKYGNLSWFLYDPFWHPAIKMNIINI